MNGQSFVKTLVKAIENDGIEGLIDTATTLYKDEVNSRLSYQQFFERTERATKPLISIDEAIYYSSTFTQEHFDRFYHVLNNLGTEIMFAQRLTVIDYGCGQGLATLAFLHYLKQNNCIANKIIDVHLIEPSVITLALARQFILAMAKHTQIQVNIAIHQQTLSEYLKAPINQKTNMATTLHFLSNVLDINHMQSDLIRLSKHINTQPNKQLICAVSSYSHGFYYFRKHLLSFNVQDEKFSIHTYRFNSNRCMWVNKKAHGQSLYAQKVA